MVKVYKDFDQRTEDWHKIKWAKVGGTASSGLFVESDTLAFNILSEQTEDFELEDSFVNKAMQDGIEKEPEAIKAVEKYTGEKFIDVAWIQSLTYDLLGISPDGVREDLKVATEVKCFTASEHLKICESGLIPKKNIYQAIHYFTVIEELKELHWGSFRPESKIKPLHVITLTRDTLISIGWTKKGKIEEDRGKGLKTYVTNEDDLRPVSEWVKLALFGALDLEDKIEEIKNKINF